MAVPPEAEWGFQLGLHKSPVDNNGGPRAQRLNETLLGPPFYTDAFYPGYAWYRRLIDLPKDLEGKPGGFVLGDCQRLHPRNYWVYLNGMRIGQSSFDDTYEGPWHATPRYILKANDAAYGKLKFGEPNLLAVQARQLDHRTPDMPRISVERFSGQSLLADQYVSCGEPTEDLTGFEPQRFNPTSDSVLLELKHPRAPLSITARYWINGNESVLHKDIVVRNNGNSPVTLLEADVLNLRIDNASIAGGGQGWPCRIGDDWFAGIEH